MHFAGSFLAVVRTLTRCLLGHLFLHKYEFNSISSWMVGEGAVGGGWRGRGGCGMGHRRQHHLIIIIITFPLQHRNLIIKLLFSSSSSSSFSSLRDNTGTALMTVISQPRAHPPPDTLSGKCVHFLFAWLGIHGIATHLFATVTLQGNMANILCTPTGGIKLCPPTQHWATYFAPIGKQLTVTIWKSHLAPEALSAEQHNL